MQIEIFQNGLRIFNKEMDDPEVSDLKVYLRNIDLQKVPKDNIEDRVCQYYSIVPGDLRTNKKTREITEAKRMVWYRLYHVNKWTLQAIGHEYHRNHTSIIFGLRAISQIPGLMERYNNIFK